MTVTYHDEDLGKLMKAIGNLKSQPADVVISEHGDLIIVTGAYTDGSYGVYIGSYKFEGLNLTVWRDEILYGLARAGYKSQGLYWVDRYTTFSSESEEWLLKRLNIEKTAYDPQLWNRDLAVEYALERLLKMIKEYSWSIKLNGR